MKKRIYWSAAGCGALYLVMQALCSVLLLTIHRQSTIENLAWATLFSQVLTCLFLWMMKKLRLPETFDPSTTRWSHASLAFAAVVFGIVATNLLNEQLPLPDLGFTHFLGEMTGNIIGILAIAIVGPIAEELIFREAAQGMMLRAGIAPWKTILFSALCFGLIHINPAQVPFAFIAGLMLGVIYYCTGNIVITSLIHIANNSLALLEIHQLGEQIDDFSYAEWMGLNGISIWMLIVGLAVISILLFRRYWLKGTSYRPVWKVEHDIAPLQPDVENEILDNPDA